MKWIKQTSICVLTILALGIPLTAQAAPEGLDNDALERLIRERTGHSGTSAASSRQSSNSQEEAGDLIMNAMSLIGLSYRFGGNSPTQGLDCSGFMQYIFKRSMGITLRTGATCNCLNTSFSISCRKISFFQLINLFQLLARNLTNLIGIRTSGAGFNTCCFLQQI